MGLSEQEESYLFLKFQTCVVSGRLPDINELREGEQTLAAQVGTLLREESVSCMEEWACLPLLNIGTVEDHSFSGEGVDMGRN